MKYIIVFSFLLTLLFGCEHDVININPNKASLVYDGQMIEFKDMKIEETELDLESGMGLRAFGEENLKNTNGFNYYVILDYRKNSTGSYQFHKINFGIKKKVGPMHYYNKVFAASLTEGFNITNFSHKIATEGQRVKGSFSGKLQSITEGEIEVNNGSFDLDFNTVRNY